MAMTLVNRGDGARGDEERPRCEALHDRAPVACYCA
jgi:hypothetical protein